MKVLIIGAAGNLGSRVVQAALDRNHTVTVLVRSKDRFATSVPDVSAKVTVIEGSAMSLEDVKGAMVGQDAVVNTAGVGAVTSFSKSTLPDIVKTVVDAAKEVIPGKRLWILGGMSVLDLPGHKGKPMAEWVPIYPEHVSNWKYIEQNGDSLDWSMLAPAYMVPGKEVGGILGTADVPPAWKPWNIPVLGPYIAFAMNIMRYTTNYEDAAAFIVDHLGPGGELSKKRVGVIYSH